MPLRLHLSATYHSHMCPAGGPLPAGWPQYWLTPPVHWLAAVLAHSPWPAHPAELQDWGAMRALLEAQAPGSVTSCPLTALAAAHQYQLLHLAVLKVGAWVLGAWALAKDSPKQMHALRSQAFCTLCGTVSLSLFLHAGT
jgi:hypothetical protein